MPRRHRRLHLGSVVVALLVAGCAFGSTPSGPRVPDTSGGARPPASGASGSGSVSSATASDVPSAASPSGSLAPSGGGASAPAPASAPPASSGGLAIDPSLLDLLPLSLSGLDRQADAEVDARAFADPALRRLGTAGASAIYLDPATGDFAYATLIRLSGGTIGDAAFRSYRDSFDEGACSQAGGVTGNAEATIGGRHTWIGTCAGGLHTYHALLPKRGVLLSISSAGSAGLGERLAAAVAG